MPLFQPPRTFQSRLRAVDPLLRCRWSDALGAYLIERRVTRGRPIAPKLLADDEAIQALEYEREIADTPASRARVDRMLRFMAEEYRAACDGYVICFEADRECLDSRVFYTLWATDLERQGGADRVNDAIDARQAAGAAASRAAWISEVEWLAHEAWRYMNRVRTVPERCAHTAPAGGMSIMGD